MSIPNGSFYGWLLLTHSAHTFKLVVFWDTVDESLLMMEAANSFDESEHIYQTKRRHMPEDRLHSHPVGT